MRTSGRNRKIMANSTVTTEREMIISRVCHSASPPGMRLPANLAKPLMAASTASETSSRNPTPSTMATERKRSLIMPKTPLLFFGSTFQMVFSASLSCPNTPDAPKISVTMPTIVARAPLFGFAALATIPCSASAPFAPISPCSCAKICPCAASRPKTNPAMAITTRISGAMENIV